jgi:geranylgeranyl reductase
VDYFEGEPVGYLMKRLIFDDLLRRLAEEAGAKAKYGLELEGLKASHDEVVASFSDGSSATSSFLIGADGVRTAVGRLSGLNPGWPSSKVVVCLNEDASWPTEKITSFYGERRSVLVVPGYSFISGYAWVFPKADEIAIGIGGRASSTSGIGETFRRFVADAKKAGLLPAESEADDPETALDPAGAAYDFHQTAHGRILLVGDAAGFVSGHTGEGIFPGMCGAEIAADAVSVTLDGQQLESLPTRYEKAWRKEIGDFMRSPDPAEMLLVGLMFSNKSLVNRVARTFLTGKRVT